MAKNSELDTIFDQLRKAMDKERVRTSDKAVDNSGFDPVNYASEYLGITLAPWQEELVSIKHGDKKKVCLLSPRQAGKSVSTSLLCATRLLQNPNYRLAVISPSLRQSGLLSEKIAEIIETYDYGQIKRSTATRIELTNGSYLDSLPGDRADTSRGISCDLLAIDEASRIKESLGTAILPVISRTQGDLILLSTPAERSGLFYEAYSAPDEDGWHKITVTMEMCPGYDEAMINTMRNTMSEAAFKMEFENQFLSEGSAFDSQAIMDMFSAFTHEKAPESTQKTDSNWLSGFTRVTH